MDHKSIPRASSSREHQEYFLADGGNTPKETPTSTYVSQENYELSVYRGPESGTTSRHKSWRTRPERFLEAHPRIKKVWLYLRGPRPKEDLSGEMIPTRHAIPLNLRPSE